MFSPVLLDEGAQGSMRQAIAGLLPGRSFSRCERLDLDFATGSEIKARFAEMRNNVNASMRRAREETGYQFTIETGSFLTSTRDFLILAVVVTRTA